MIVETQKRHNRRSITNNNLDCQLQKLIAIIKAERLQAVLRNPDCIVMVRANNHERGTPNKSACHMDGVYIYNEKSLQAYCSKALLLKGGGHLLSRIA
ncbi:MAG: hypothetical protein KH437_07305, partial [Prevotella sp.]|nr:hypothetical protein [Prevotella sp.]